MSEMQEGGPNSLNIPDIDEEVVIALAPPVPANFYGSIRFIYEAGHLRTAQVERTIKRIKQNRG